MDEQPAETGGRRRAGTALGGLAFGFVAATLLGLQIALSRLFGSTLTYYYAFMLISLAMLGLAAGAVATSLWPRIFPPDRAWSRAAWFSLATGISIALGVLCILAIYPQVQFEADRFHVANTWALAAIFWLCFPPFLFGGVVVSGVLSRARVPFHRFYAIDLLFAAAGCAMALILMEALTPVEVLLRVFSVLPIAAAALFALQAGERKLAFGALALTVAFGWGAQVAAAHDSRAKPPHLAWRDKTEVLSEWNSTSAVRVYPAPFFTWALSPNYRGPSFPMLNLIIDGLGGTPIVAFDGKPESLARYGYLDEDLTALAQHLVPREGRQLIIGPGGGVDILQAVRHGRSDITAVEINPLIRSVVNESLGRFSGRPYELPGVRVAIENGRTFVKRSHERWDLITLTWVDTGGSATALAFSENYLYTTEAFEEYAEHLSDTGMFAFLRAWDSGVRVDSMRGVAVAMEALRRRGVDQPQRHTLVAAAQSRHYGRAMCLVLVRKLPFSPTDLQVARAFLGRFGFEPIWLPDDSVRPGEIPPRFAQVAAVIRETIQTPDPESLYRSSAFDIAPSTDDNPFYFVERAGEHREAGIGVRQIRTYSLILLALVLPVLALPLLSVSRNRAPLGPLGRWSLVYFALLGLSFMLVEIEFFHRFALLLGKPTLTLTIVLSSLLIFSGLGSLLGARLADSSQRALVMVFFGLCAALGLFAWHGTYLLDLLIQKDLSVRLLGTVAVIAPLGFLMGVPMPAGMRLISDRQDLVLWGWALNGAVSVFASVVAIHVAIHRGIAFTFFLGVAGYGAAGLAAVQMKRRSQRGRVAA